MLRDTQQCLLVFSISHQGSASLNINYIVWLMTLHRSRGPHCGLGEVGLLVLSLLEMSGQLTSAPNSCSALREQLGQVSGALWVSRYSVISNQKKTICTICVGSRQILCPCTRQHHLGDYK